MEYESYRVPREEKLEDLARQFGLTIKELQELNPQMEIFKNFWGTETYVVVNQLIKVPVKSEKIGNEKFSREQVIPFPLYSWQKNGKYQINISSYLTLGKGKINQTQSDEVWDIGFDDKNNHLDIMVSEKKYLKIDSQMKPVYELIEIINKAFRHLQLKLDEDKTVLKVVNEDEIKKNWDIIKKTDLRFYELIKDSYKKIVETYDEELNRITENIRANLLYQIIFFPYEKISPPQVMWRYLKKNKTVSALFPDGKVEYETQYKVNKENGIHHIKINGYNTRISEFTNDFSSQYIQRYESLLKIPLEYGFHIEGDYYYNEAGILEKALFHIKESLNEAMYYVCKYEIKLINQEKV